MDELTKQIASLNDNAKDLLEKYDGVFNTLSLQLKQALVDIAEKGDANLKALENILNEGSVDEAKNALKLEGKSFEEIVEILKPKINKIIIDETTSLQRLESFGVDVSGIASTFNRKSLGIYWGAADNRKYVIEVDVPIGSTSFSITYSGYYDDPSKGLGNLSIKDEAENSLLSFSDAWTNGSEGQSLYINSKRIFEKKRTNVKSRTDIIHLNGAQKIYITMSGRKNYPYTNRFIEKLIFN